jgi:hypothetical protein
VGAHYDSVLGSPGANDNGTGVASLIELSRLLTQPDLQRTVRFVFFVNEEPPFFTTGQMGSLRYARQGYPGVMVTDTALFRYEHYHMPGDTPDRVRYGHLARVVAGLEKVIVDLASE